MSRAEKLVLTALVASVAGLFIERVGGVPPIVVHLIDFSVVALMVAESAWSLRSAPYPRLYAKSHALSLAFVAVFAAAFAYTKYLALCGGPAPSAVEGLQGLVRTVFLVLKAFGRIRKLARFAESFASHPAQTIVLSFALAILAGCLALMADWAVADSRGLGFLDALFTSTSAVCVTGLVLVDTGSRFTIAGQAVILALIQAGGLGIMLFSSFAVFMLRRKVSLKDRLFVSYMLSEDDMSGLRKALGGIALATLLIEIGGALILLGSFSSRGWPLPRAVFFALFHSISAFCNAGFALFPDSLESFRSDPVVTLTITVLIVLGGISFSVINELFGRLRGFLRNLRRPGTAGRTSLSLNAAIVLKITAALLAAGLAGFYLLEHAGAMRGYRLGEQYLAALFQSVTLRTAGFNSVPFGSLRDSTLLFMIVFMFIGGASGGTAGGIKLNSLAVVGAYFSSFLRQEKEPRIGRHAISPDKVGKSLIIILFGLCAVVVGTFALTLSERGPFLPLLFEAVSAFGTVGLSAGVTPGLSAAGKAAILSLMFLGRLGPLTILSAASRRPEPSLADYPYAEISLG
jgi:trk system potassium uptake protein TrkH